MTSHQFNWDVDTWTTLDSFYNQDKILTQHQLESFNNLVDFVIPQIIEKNNPVVIATEYSKELKDFKKKCTIKFMQTYLSKPLIHENTDVIKPLYPNEARLRNLTYAAPMFIDVECTITDSSKAEKADANKPEYERRIPFLKLPVMLHSKYCHLSDRTETGLTELGECEYDQGGYFIVNGGEKVLISQERVAENQVFVWTPPKTTTNKYTHEAEIKSSIDQRFYPVKTNKVKLTKEPTSNIIKDANKQGVAHGRTLHVQMPYIKDHIPLFIMFRALGVATEKEMFEMIMPDLETIGSNYLNFLIPSVDEARIATVIIGDNKEQVMTQQQALTYLAERLNITFTAEFKKQHTDAQIKYVKDILSRELFPHIGQMSPSIGHTFRKKAFFLGYMTRKLIDCYFGVRPYDDRDHYGNKRVDLAGPLITSLFRTHFIKLIRDIRKDILPKLTGGGEIDKNGVMLILRKTIQGCNIDSKIKYGLSTGNWSTQKTSLSTSKKGIAQVLNRMSFAGALSHTRRIQSPLERAGSKIVPPRRLHGTHFGMCCPNETPEGQQIGIVKNLAMQTHVTIQTSDYPIRIILNKLGVIDLIETVAVDVNHSTKIFVNGDWFGVISEDRTRQLYHRLKTLKRHGVIVPYISIAWFICWNEIHIQTDGGRYSRPLYVVEDGLIIEDGHLSEESYVDECQLLIERQCQEVESFNQKFKQGELKWPQFLFGYHDGVFDVKTASIDNGGVIEYLDTNEIETSMIAMTRADMNINRENNNYYVRYTHCEIHPMMMMGVVSAVIPFSDHNQSPRNCYQCLWKEEEVIMNDGSVKKIGDIKVGDYVITVDPSTLEQKPAKVINQYVKTTEKKIVKVTTLSGRTIICTEDHPILTYNGWKDAGKLTNQDLMCICPNLVSYPLDKTDLILDKDQFITTLQEKGIKDSLITDHLSHLNVLGILPIYQNSPAIPILSRIFGFCITDGSIGIYSRGPQMTMTFGLLESGEEYLRDVESLGFQRNKITEVSSEIHGVSHHGWQVIYNNALVSLIIALGPTMGKRTECSNNEVPNWIKNGSKLVKREFLAGFQGGDGCKIRYNHLKNRKSPNFILNVTSLTKCSAHLDSLKLFMNQIKQLFNEFGITSKDTRVRVSKSYEDRYAVELPFECSRDNIINYFEKIGYRYDLYKYRDSLPIYEYLKYHQSLVNQIDVWKIKIAELKNNGKTYPEIALQLGLTAIKCADLYKSSLQCSHSRVPNEYLPIDTWLNTIKMANNSIFVPINKIEPHENVEIADITIDADTHSFITGQHICVHNSSMAKQSIGYYATNYNSRMDTMAHVLVYGHKPLVSTRLAKYALMDKLPHGETAMLLYACYTGYNQEDSIVVNKDAVERGFFNTLFFRSYTDKAQKHRSVTTATERFTKPDKKTTRGIKVHGSYDAIDSEGRPIVGKIVKGNDVIIGKVIELKEKDPENFSNKDVSTTTRPNEYGTIDKVISDIEGGVLPYNADGHRFIKARVSILRKPEIGDKFASRYSQKGTTGILYRSIDMPFTCYGLVPDMIMNPHGIPSRMTVGKLLETLLGKVAVSSGQVQDATPFVSYDFEKFKETLKRYGMDELGNEVMYNGQTGEMFDTVFFYGPTYYQRLKHMVDDKVHSRESGPVQLLTRQPAEGRSREGGLRLGEMERDVLIAHGIPKFLKERMMDSSDLFKAYVSKKEETLIIGNPEQKIFKFNGQNIKDDEVVQIQFPYAMKLLLQELQSMGLDMRLHMS